MAMSSQAQTGIALAAIGGAVLAALLVTSERRDHAHESGSGPCQFCACSGGVVGCATDTGIVPAGQHCTVCQNADGSLVPCLQPIPVSG